MKVATCIKGFEDIAAKEVKGKKIAEGHVIFSGPIKKFRTVNNIYSLYKNINFTSITDIVSEATKCKINKKLRVYCKRDGIHNFRSVDVEKAIAAELRSKGYQVDFKDYKETLYIDIIDNLCFIGKLIKENLCKRDYRIKLSPGTINACLAASILKLVDLKKGEILLDPLCRDGIFALEASYYTNKVYAYGLDVYSARINARIGKRKITFGNYDLDWLMTKFKENSVDKIITFLPSTSKRRKNIKSFYRKFFHNSVHILKGRMAILSYKSDLVKEHALDLKLLEERKVSMGNEVYYVLIFGKDI